MENWSCIPDEDFIASLPDNIDGWRLSSFGFETKNIVCKKVFWGIFVKDKESLYAKICVDRMSPLDFSTHVESQIKKWS